MPSPTDPDHETPVGVPRGAPRHEVDPPPRRERRSDVPEPGLREGDTGLGRAASPPTRTRPVSESDLEEIEARDRSDEEAAFAAAERSSLRLPGFLFSTTFVLAVAALGALVVLLVIGQAVELAERLLSAPVWLRWPAWGALGLLLLVVVAAALRLVVASLRLRRVGQVDVRALAALAERGTLRRLAGARLDAAVDRLSAYLEAYPLEGDAARARLVRSGFSPEQLDRLVAQRARLLDRDRHPGAEPWLQEFASGFQAELEAAARRRVIRAARLVAAKTAVTPRSIDTAIVLHAALAMVGDLCRIFQLRLGTLGTAVVLGRAFALAYLSGQLQQATETLTRDAAADGAGQLLHGLPEGIGQVGSKIAGALAPKVAEGTANGILLWRLGIATIRLLRPVAPIQK